MSQMTERGTWQNGDTVVYLTETGNHLRGKVVGVKTKLVYSVIPEGTLGIVDTVDELP